MANATGAPTFWDRFREARHLTGLVIRLVWRASPHLLLGIVLLLVAQALLPALQLLIARAVLDRAGFDLGLVTRPDPLSVQFSLATWIVLAATTIAVSQLVQPFIATFQSLAGDRLTGYVNAQVLRATTRWQGIARFEEPGFADDLRRIREHAAGGGLTLVVHGALVAMTLLTAISLSLLLSTLHPLIPLLLVVCSFPSAVRYWEYGTRTGSLLYWQTPETRRLEYCRDVLLLPETAKDVRLYGLAPFFLRAYTGIFDHTVGMLDRLRHQLRHQMIVANVVAAVPVGALFIYLVWSILQGEHTVGDLVLYGGGATLLQMHLLDLGLSIGDLPLLFGFLPSLFRVLEAPPDLTQPNAPKQISRPLRQGIVFEDVTFTYPGRAEPVLNGVSFSLQPREAVALVGHNGAGKTTVVKLLLRLYDPTAGRILLDGVDLREYDLRALRNEIGVIFQDFVRYELTVRENVGLGRLDALHDDRRLWAAAVQAGADGLIQQLPRAWDTPLGREFGERDLSGGEWQKLALARAFVRDAQILVLDEPTAALDVQTEYDVYTRFHDLTRDRMTLLISHRFSTVRMADRILYLADGQIQEAGSHAELMQRNGEYARLYRLQAKQYLDAKRTERRA